MEIYIIEDYKEKYKELKGRELTDKLIKYCLEEYGVLNPEILRTSKGKPYVETHSGFSAECPLQKGEVHFSVSHSGNYFLCVIADKNVGVDIQNRRKANLSKIAERYFTEEEIRLIEDSGDDAFFYIWARKEAYSKYTGKGLQELIQGTPVLERNDVEFVDFQIEEDMWCSCCIERK